MSDTTTNAVRRDASEPAPAGGVSILLKEVTKRYPRTAGPAVDGLTLEIPAGSLVVLVGPSGCGKTTTLKMINRLIEPTEGSIIIGGDDVTTMNGDALRRSIGYVIQAGGLFPHMTVGANVGLVPKMLGWQKKRIAARTDELLELVSLDPAVYRDRYPKELSGGQQQRVGVARALAADPPVLLMDEPFGAVDPITRARLQDELLALHDELGKTIVFVTHDFDEATKLGDWIAVFDMRAHLVQYDSPDAILSQPANDFVSGFIGSGAGLKQLSLTRAGSTPLGTVATTEPGAAGAEVLAQLRATRQDSVVVVDRRRRPIQWLDRDELSTVTTITDEVDDGLPVVGEQSTLNEALDAMLVTAASGALVTGRRGALKGVLTIDSVTRAISDAHRAAASHETPVGLNTSSIPVVADADAARNLEAEDREQAS